MHLADSEGNTRYCTSNADTVVHVLDDTVSFDYDYTPILIQLLGQGNKLPALPLCALPIALPAVHRRAVQFPNSDRTRSMELLVMPIFKSGYCYAILTYATATLATAMCADFHWKYSYQSLHFGR